MWCFSSSFLKTFYFFRDGFSRACTVPIWDSSMCPLATRRGPDTVVAAGFQECKLILGHWASVRQKRYGK